MDGSGGDTSSDDERSLLGPAPGTSIARASPWLESAPSVSLEGEGAEQAGAAQMLEQREQALKHRAPNSRTVAV